MNVKSCNPRTILWVLSCIHTTNFYQWNIYLPRENYLNLPVVKFILGFNFIRWKGHTNLCHRCLGKIIKRQNVLARKSHRKHAWNSRISKFFLSVHFTLHFILFDEHSDLNIFFSIFGACSMRTTTHIPCETISSTLGRNEGWF